METSIFLAKLIGPMMLVMGIFVVFNPQRIQAIGREFLDSDALIFLSGVITLPVGIAIVITHNIWEADWRTVITFFGWVAVFAGIARMILPDPIKQLGETMLENKFMITPPGALMMILGAFLSYHGYFA
jgi:hypothetical protein